VPYALYGEARRLRYFFLICSELLKKSPISEQNFHLLLGESFRNINYKLEYHVRSTGILQTSPVAKNYLSYCKWLDLFIKEGKIIMTNGNTIFFANICDDSSFKLSDLEKISMFILIAKNELFIELLSSLKPSSSPKDFVPKIGDEHLVETLLEWCVDFDILLSASKKFGTYKVNYKFSNLIKNIDKYNLNEIIRLYCSYVLNVNILLNRKLDETLVWNQIILSLNKTKKYTRSEIDNNLYSALPFLLDLQAHLILKYQTFYSFDSLINIVQKIALSFNSFFTWNYMKHGGQIKIGV